MIQILTPLISGIIFSGLKIYEIYAPNGVCDRYSIFLCNFYMVEISRFTILLGLIFIFSLAALFFRKDYFRNWWRFAWWGGPLTIGVIMLVNAGFHHTGGGFMNLDNILDDEIVFLAYFFFGVGSLVQFWRTYKQVK